ncbi:PucR family transcriptional regulator [Paenibacillaceae bacterium]|nr:PucR family transcriptional regulator [Paenibacillaceae bacterium]
MGSAQWKEQLEQIIGGTLQLKQVKVTEWLNFVPTVQLAEDAGIPAGASVVAFDKWLWFAVRTDGNEVEVLELAQDQVTSGESRLIGWALNQLRLDKKLLLQSAHETERQSAELGKWIQERLTAGDNQAEVPDYLTAGGRLFAEMIPFLLVSEHAPRKNSYYELEKLLKSFFEEEVMLIPIKEQEWLIMGQVSLLKEADTGERSEEEDETEEDLLASMCSGLHGMLASEWVGECHVAVAAPIAPAKSIVDTTQLLRETIYLGRKFHVGANIHLPWLLHLERLLNSIPEPQRGKYIEQVLNRSDVVFEPEILMTLETFFGLDCNVSETAKRLYIHRNTLLYRLDKLKQETGLDVRLFSDAVLVKIILLLYKVTKRK